MHVVRTDSEARELFNGFEIIEVSNVNTLYDADVGWKKELTTTSIHVGDFASTYNQLCYSLPYIGDNQIPYWARIE